MQEGKNNEKGKDKEEKDKERTKEEKGKEKESDRKGETEKEKLKGIEGTNLDGLLQRLPGCVSRDLIDQLTVRISMFVCPLMFSVILRYHASRSLLFTIFFR